MRIGFTGVHGTGKTTLLKGMVGWPELNGHAIISGLTRMQAAQGIKINKEGNFDGQKALVKAMSWHLKTLPNVVLDRTLLDIYAYTVYQRDNELCTSQDLNYIRNRARAVQHLFDVVFFVRPEFELQGDDFRSEDPAFAIEVAAAMEHAIKYEPLGTRNIIIISGTVEERLKTIQEWINENKI